MTYEQFINDRIDRVLPEDVYTEKHHILPKCKGGKDNKENIIRLTGAEHYEAHKLLADENPDDLGLQRAWYMMACGPKHFMKGEVIYTAEDYGRLREISEWSQSEFKKTKQKQKEEARKFKEERRKTRIDLRLRGHKHTEEEKKKIGDAHRGRKNTWAVKGIKRSEETKEKLRKLAREQCSRAVKCVETGVVYPSRREAAKQIGCKEQNLCRAVTHPTRTAGGYHWVDARTQKQKRKKKKSSEIHWK